MDSIWTKSSSLPQFETLQGNKKTDVLIIGGGITGILCAHFLKEMGVNYMLVERNSICSQITKNTTAKITAQHGLIYDKLIRSIGVEKAKMYLDANLNALQMYRTLCNKMDCDFETKTSYVYSLDNRRKLEKEMLALEKIGYVPKFTETSELPFEIAGAVGFHEQAQFHPLKFLTQIAKDLNIYEYSRVKELTEHTAILENGNVEFSKLIIATHFPMENRHGLYFLKLYQHRSYVIALADVPKLEGMYIDENKHGLSFRSYKHLLLLGGGSHKTGKKGGNWQELRNFAGNYYPDKKEEYFWATQDCMSLDGVSYIGRYGKHRPNWYVASGFNKWGMTSSMAAAMILTDMVLEKTNPYADVFDPSRSMLKPQLFLNGCSAAAGLLTPVRKRCPHLGCALKWNKDERSWDCACHGSRFDMTGRLLSNPANGDLER